MNKFLLISTFLIFSFNTTLIAEEKKCKRFSIGCKMGKWIKGTAEFQKKGFKDAKEQLKKGSKK